jgi:hypothetical protein
MFVNMRTSEILLFVILLVSGTVAGQTRTITGKVIDDQFHTIIGARINNLDTVLLTVTDTEGNFKLNIPTNTKSLIITGIGFERKLINLTVDCSHLEVIMLQSGSYDFMSARKVDRLRKKYFESLPKLHQFANEKGIFQMPKPCYLDKFIPISYGLEAIHRARIKMPST